MNFTICSPVQDKKIITDFKNSPELPFNKVLTAEEINKTMDKLPYRNRIFTPSVTLWAFLSQVMDADPSQQMAVSRVVAEAIVQGKEPPSSNTAGYSKARSRLPEDVVSSLVIETAEQLVANTPSEWLWNGRRIKLVDGSTLSMPDTKENQAAYPQPDTQKIGIGFPIARIVAIIDYITGVVMNLAIAPYGGKETGEHALFRQIISSINFGDVLLGDCYYPSYFLMATLIRLGVDGVFPMHNARNYDFSTGTYLGNKDHISTWGKPAKPSWMEQNEYDLFPATISIREVEIKNQRLGFRDKKMVLVTTFLDPSAATREALANLYDYRWYVEISLLNIKNTMKMDILRGNTPEMVRKEIWVHLLAYNLIRKIMAQAAFVHDKSTNELSFKLALQTIKSFQQKGLLDDEHAYMKLLDAIAYKKVGNRKGRYEPRCVKRRPKAFPLLQQPRKLYKNVA
jgi:hypothetical protein